MKPRSRKTRAINHRWGRTDDRILFSTIKKLQAEGNLSTTFLEHIHSNNSNIDFSELEYLASLVNWTGKPECLKQRIQVLSSNSHAMSVRETKLLRKIIINDYYQKPIDYEAVSLNFLGKSIDTLKIWYMRMFKYAESPEGIPVLNRNINTKKDKLFDVPQLDL